jgi:valyl-tRNA synthetase
MNAAYLHATEQLNRIERERARFNIRMEEYTCHDLLELVHRAAPAMTEQQFHQETQRLEESLAQNEIRKIQNGFLNLE